MQSGEMHNLLKRQIKRAFGESFAVPDEWSGFIDMVNSAYHESDTDRNMLERSMDLSSQELLQANAEMRAIFEAVPDIFFRVDDSGTILDCKTGNTSDLLTARQNLIGKKIFDMPSVSAADKFRQALEDVRQTKAAVSFEYSLILHEMENFCEARLIPLLKDQAIIIIRNVTDRKYAEKALAKSEKRLLGITTNMPGVVFQFYAKDSGEYGISYVSERVSEIFEVPLDTKLEDLFPIFISHIKEEDLDRFTSSVQNAVKTISPWSFEGRYIKPSGKMFWFHAMTTPTRHEDRLVFDGILLDVTERKKMEESLRRSEEYFKAVTENSSDIIIVTDKKGDIKYCSLSAERFTGYKPEELIGRNVIKFIHPDDVKRAVDDFGKAVLEKDSVIPNEFRIVHKDGSERYVEGLGKNLLDNPTIAGYIMNVHDITERKLADELLRKNEERYRALVENASDIVFRTDDTGHYTFVNPATLRITGYSEEELIGKHYNALVRPDKHKEAMKVFVGQYESRVKNTYLEFPIVRKDDHEAWIGQNTQLIIDGDQVIGFQAVARDITERKRVEDELQQTLGILRKSIGVTIQVMVSAIEVRDPYTAGHQKRVSDLARSIATEMGLDMDKIEGIRMSGSIHDIGKLAIPSEILTKPTKLTNLEFSLIKEHSQSGYDMLKDVESPWPLAQIVYQHHERMNGSGYPRKLKGDEILIEARIMAVADVVEAMASHRPYRPSLGLEAALEEIEKNKGIIYDADVADACLKLFREKRYHLK